MALVTQMQAEWTGWPGGPGLSTFHIVAIPDDTVAPIPGALVNAGSVLQGLFSGQPANIPNDVTIRMTGEAVTMDVATGQLISVASYTTPGSTTGSCTGTVWASPVGLQCTWLTGGIFGGRRLAGRTNIVPLCSVMEEGSPGSAAITAAAVAAASVVSGSQGAVDWKLAIWRRPWAGSPQQPGRPPYPGAYARVTGSIVRDKATILRSRRD